MTAIRTLLFGSVAVCIAASNASAADMIRDVKAPREPVYRCDIAGFIELPGTEICFRVGGFAMFVGVGTQDNWFGFEGYSAWTIEPDGHKLGNTLEMYATGRLHFDARMSTEYGAVRAYVEVQAYDNDTRTGGPFNLRHAFVQFGNWTFGKTWSTFLHLGSSPVYSDVFTVAGDNFIRRNQIRYTQSFGNGFSVSVGIEDQAYDSPMALEAVGIWASGAPGVVNDRNEFPDVVANIRTEGDWGNAQLSGAVHNNRFREVDANNNAPAPLMGNQTDGEIGWAALFGLVVNTPSVGEGDYFTFKAIYTDGATEYNEDNFLRSSNVVWGLCSTAMPAQGGCITDSVKTWSVLASYTHNWSPSIATTFGGGYQNVDAPLTTNAPLLLSGASDFDMDTYEIFGNISWSPVNNLTFMLDVHYGHVDFNGSGTYAGVFNPFLVNPLANDDDGAFSIAFDAVKAF